MRIFIGSSERFKHIEHVIYYSIIENCPDRSIKDKITFLRPHKYGYREIGCTGFSVMRYYIPQLMEYKGTAIYLDVDMLVLTDINHLFNMAEPGKWLCTPGGTEVSVIDCSAYRFLDFEYYMMISKDDKTLKGQFEARIRAEPILPCSWNHEDILLKDTNILHFTDLKTQPWFYNNHPDRKAFELWENYRNESVARKIQVD